MHIKANLYAWHKTLKHHNKSLGVLNFFPPMKVKRDLVSTIKREALVWFFFIVCCNYALSASFSESTLVSKADDYKHLAKEQPPIKNGYDGSKVMKPNEVGRKSKALKGLHEVLNLETGVSKGKECIGINIQSKKAGRGGVNGGGDLLRPRRKKSGASSISLTSSSSIAIKALALGLLLLVFF